MRAFIGLYPMLILLASLTAARGTEADDASTDSRGGYLAIAGDCAACHTAPGGAPFAGGLPMQTPIGVIFSTNITPSKTNGIGNYTLAQFDGALRRGVRADGRHLYPAMPYTSYAKMSDDDVKALYEYFIHAVPPADTPSLPTRLPFPFNIRLSMTIWNFLFLDRKSFEPDASKSAEWNRGAYLVLGLAHCSACHSPRNILMAEKSSHDLAGGAVGTWYAPNITSDVNSGIGNWSVQELVDYLHDGHAVGKAQAAGPMAEAIDASLQHLNYDDLRSIAVYLKTVPAQHDRTDTRPAFAWGAAASDLGDIRGIALSADRDRMSGPQLYDAYCAACHQSSAQGSEDNGLPSLFRNTTLGRANTDNLVMVMLEGVRRQSDTRYMMMPGFAATLSDHQVATLGEYLVQRYGNPEARVTAEQVARLRTGETPSALVTIIRIAIVVAVLVLLLGGFWAFKRWSAPTAR